ncbi:hypothetical protein BGZ83_011854 [Gryganskiella cystojenkinii]|nr:hypothetical protein BGZ83_011854 [Gryganskiella cystojenkinii]
MKSNTVLSLTFVIGLLVYSTVAAPIIKRDDGSCPGTLRGPSGNEYFSFSTNLNNRVARQACASCYGGILANANSDDVSFLTLNLAQDFWIKSWNGDDYSGSCLTIRPNEAGTLSVSADATCAVESWPLCQATTGAEGSQKTEIPNDATLSSLAVAYTLVPTKTQSDPPSVPDTTTTADEGNTEAEIEVVATNTEGNSPSDPAATTTSDHEDAAAVEIEAASKAEGETPAKPTATTTSLDGTVAEVVEVVATKTVTEEEATTSKPEATTTSTSENEAAETEEVVTAAPEDPLLVRKERVRSAFEEEKEACSAELAMGEQDPVTNEYEIEEMFDHDTCSKIQHEATKSVAA